GGAGPCPRGARARGARTTTADRPWRDGPRWLAKIVGVARTHAGRRPGAASRSGPADRAVRLRGGCRRGAGCARDARSVAGNRRAEPRPAERDEPPRAPRACGRAGRRGATVRERGPRDTRARGSRRHVRALLGALGLAPGSDARCRAARGAPEAAHGVPAERRARPPRSAAPALAPGLRPPL